MLTLKASTACVVRQNSCESKRMCRLDAGIFFAKSVLSLSFSGSALKIRTHYIIFMIIPSSFAFEV